MLLIMLIMSIILDPPSKKQLSHCSVPSWCRYLQQCCLDEELLSLKRFDEYRPVDCPLAAMETCSKPTFPASKQHMVCLTFSQQGPYTYWKICKILEFDN